jgi:urease accessory protein
VNGRVEATVTGERVTHLSCSPPLAAKVLPGPTLLLVGSAAGLLEGDRCDVRLRLGRGSRMTVRTVAATLAHACPTGGSTAFDVEIDLGAGARLTWSPEPLVAHAGCRHRSTARVSLAAGAAAMWSETLSLGRSGEEAGDVEVRLDVELDRVPLLRDGLRAGPSAAGWAGPAVLAGARHLGTVALLGTRLTTDDPNVMDLAGPGALARALADDAVVLERRLAPVRRLFLDRLTSPEEFSNVA